MGRLDGKVAIVTGASRGIGKQVAIAFAKEGARVAVVARSERPPATGKPGTIHETANEIAQAGGQAKAIRANVVDEGDVKAMVQQVLDQWGRVDILLNNVGGGFTGSFLQSTTEHWKAVIDMNLLATFLCSRAVAPIMVQQRSGSIINTSSLAAGFRMRTEAGIAYGTAKAAVEHLTCEMAGELGQHNIAVNCYLPAGIVVIGTPAARVAANSPWPIVGPENMIKVAIFLAQQDAKGVTGCVASDQEYVGWHGL